MTTRDPGTGKVLRAPKSPRERGTACIWPRGIELMYGITPPTRRRWEGNRRLPPRDFYIAGQAVGWKPETIAAAQAGEVAA
jgi:hypothetical protein